MVERLFVRDKDGWSKLASADYHIDKLPEVFEVEKGIALPCRDYSGGICDSEFLFKAGLCRNVSDPNCWGTIKSGYVVDKNSLKFIDETVVFGGVIIPHFGHMMLDCLTRLWWHVENPDSNLRFIFVVLTRGFDGWKDFIWEYFDLLGIARERILVINEPTQFAKIIVPEEAAHGWSGYTDKWESVFELMAKNATAYCVCEGGGVHFLKKYIYQKAGMAKLMHKALMKVTMKIGIGNMVTRLYIPKRCHYIKKSQLWQTPKQLPAF